MRIILLTFASSTERKQKNNSVEVSSQMQMNKKITEETRTFPEIWKSLTTAQQDHLRSDLKDRLKVTAAAVWYWYNGQRRPDYLCR